MELKAETNRRECPASQELEYSVVAEGLSKVSVANIDETMEDCLSSYFSGITLRCVISVVCVTNEREESVGKQHNLFRKMYSNNETTCFGL